MENMELSKKFWSKKKVFITGHTGFKGGWTSLLLQSLSSDVTGFSLKPKTSPNLYESANVSQEMNSVFGDILDFNNLRRNLLDADPEIIIHMAAQPLVRDSYIDPVETFKTNVIGTANILEISREIKSLKAVLVITSDKCYENTEKDVSYLESDRLGGHDPYSSSKACAELVTSSFRDSFFTEKAIKISSARAGNVIGGGDWSKDRLIPDILKAIQNNDDITLRYPNAVRPWQHVLEPIYGYLKLIEYLCSSDGSNYASAWNFGPHERNIKTVEWITKKLVSIYNSKSLIKHETEKKPHEANILKLDASKAMEMLNWHPILDVHEALEMISDWHNAFLKGVDMKSYTMSQINLFERKISCKMS